MSCSDPRDRVIQGIRGKSPVHRVLRSRSGQLPEVDEKPNCFDESVAVASKLRRSTSKSGTGRVQST